MLRVLAMVLSVAAVVLIVVALLLARGARAPGGPPPSLPPQDEGPPASTLDPPPTDSPIPDAPVPDAPAPDPVEPPPADVDDTQPRAATSLGIVAGSVDAAAANTRALRAQVSPAAYGGQANGMSSIYFPDAATYHFDDVVPLKPGTRLDLRGSTLRFAKTATIADRGAGFLFALRDVVIENGTIRVDYDNPQRIIHAGAALVLGTRKSTGSVYFSDVLDATLDAPMGDIVLKDLHIVSAQSSAEPDLRVIMMLGGLQNVVFENLSIDGSGDVAAAIYYEFGNATLPKNPATVPMPDIWLSSHAHNLRFTNISIRNLADDGQALSLVGAYDALVDGLIVDGAGVGFFGSAGEAAFYRTWGSVPPTRLITLRNIEMRNLSSHALVLGGSGSFKGGYLGRWLPDSPLEDQVDLLDYRVEGFALEGSSTGWGIFASARRIDIQEGTMRGFARGMVVTNDCTQIHVSDVKILDSVEIGAQLNFEAGVLSVPRNKSGSLRRSQIAGSGSIAIAMNHVGDFTIEENVFGYEDEKTQSHALWLGPQSSGVVARDNKVRGIAGKAVAYRSLSSSTANVLIDARGVDTSAGRWARQMPTKDEP